MSNFRNNKSDNSHNTVIDYVNKGSTIEITLPEEGITNGYSVECTYKYNKYIDRYMLSMWLKKENDGFTISHNHIGTMPVSGNRETIIGNICRIVDQAVKTGYFTPFIQSYERTKRCYDTGLKVLMDARKTLTDVGSK